MSRRLLPALLATALLGGCATPSLTLLPSEEDKQGAVAVIEKNGKPVETVVSELNSRTNLSGTPRTRAIDPSRMDKRQIALLQNLPPTPVYRTLYFREGTTRLMPESEPNLDELKRVIRDWPGAEVQVTGYTDTLGSAEDNDLLSQRRAEEVSGALAEQGIAKGLLSAVGRGERDLLRPTPDETREAINRRVVVIVR